MFMSFQRYKYDISYHNLSIIAIFFFLFTCTLRSYKVAINILCKWLCVQYEDRSEEKKNYWSLYVVQTFLLYLIISYNNYVIVC